MKSIGIDIGTTNIGAVVFENGRVAVRRTVESRSFIPSPNFWERIQDPAGILSIATSLVDELLAAHPDAACIGVTGQQHGIVYLDSEGNPLSPLYTWQDGRGDQPFGDGPHTYVTLLQQETGCPLASGYGCVTHFYNLKNGLVPAGTSTFCAIHDFVAMKLAGLHSPLVDASNAASFGLFDVATGRFDTRAAQNAGIHPSIFPSLAGNPVIGEYRGVPVAVAIGDNQASFLGAAATDPGTMLVNVGTGSQFSMLTSSYMKVDGLETRPFPGGGYLLVGASLCGGRAYAMLDNFFCDAVGMVTGNRPEHCYDAMGAAAGDMSADGDPVAVTLFGGTRQDPSARGSLTGIDTDNFTPAALVRAFVRGIATELYDMSRLVEGAGTLERGKLYGSGNGLRMNALLREALEGLFGRPVILSDEPEEAACGAALFAQKSFI